MQFTRRSMLESVAGVSAGLGALPAMAGTARTGLADRKIAEVAIYPFFMEAKQTIRIALGAMLAEEVLVRVRTADGLVGWGEASPYAPVTGETQASAIAVGKGLAAMLRGRDPFEIPHIVADLELATTGHPGIRAAIEMSLWDICGKIAGQPVCHLLGQYRDSFETDRTVYLDTPETMAAKAQEVVESGFHTVKVKVGETPEMDIERLRVIRARLGKQIRLRIDANQGWTPTDAVRALRGMEAFGVQFCEQPVVHSDWEGLKYVREHAGIAIMADEAVHSPADAIEAVRRDAADSINIKLMKTGGILRATQIAVIAAAADMTCMLGCMSETRIALTAAAHVVASQKNVLYADLDAFTEHKIDPVTGGMQVANGIVTVADAPGLGLDIDPAFLKTLRAA